MFPTEDIWTDRNYQYLMDEAVHLEIKHGNFSDKEVEVVRMCLESMVRTCSLLRRPDFNAFAEFYRKMCTQQDMHPLTVDAFLRAAWKASDDEAKGVRAIPGKAENEVRARELRRALIMDTEESWAYEGLHVQFRSDLEEGEDPAMLARSDGKPSALSIAELEEGMRRYIEDGGLDAHHASVAAAFEARQGSKDAGK